MRMESRAEEDPFTTQEELFKEKLRERRAKPVTYELLTWIVQFFLLCAFMQEKRFFSKIYLQTEGDPRQGEGAAGE